MEYIYIGKIVNTHGIKGELRIISNNEIKDKIFIKGRNLYIGENKIREVINTYRVHKNFDMVTFEEYDNINQVLKYLKQNVYVKKDELDLDNNEYILEELIGFNVIEDNKVLGKVKEIVYNKSNVLLSIEALIHFYIPNNDNFIKSVDLDKKEIIVENTKGLIL